MFISLIQSLLYIRGNGLNRIQHMMFCYIKNSKFSLLDKFLLKTLENDEQKTVIDFFILSCEDSFFSELHESYQDVTLAEFSRLMLLYITQVNKELWFVLYCKYNLSNKVLKKKFDDCMNAVWHVFLNTVLNSVGYFTENSEAPELLLRDYDPVNPIAEVLIMISNGMVEGLDNLEAARCALEVLDAKEDAHKNSAAFTV